jgi:hypothetical protein
MKSILFCFAISQVIVGNNDSKNLLIGKNINNVVELTDIFKVKLRGVYYTKKTLDIVCLDSEEYLEFLTDSKGSLKIKRSFKYEDKIQCYYITEIPFNYSIKNKQITMHYLSVSSKNTYEGDATYKTMCLTCSDLDKLSNTKHSDKFWKLNEYKIQIGGIEYIKMNN